MGIFGAILTDELESDVPRQVLMASFVNHPQSAAVVKPELTQLNRHGG